MRANAHATAVRRRNLDGLEALYILNGAAWRDHGGTRFLLAADTGQSGAAGAGIAAAGTADHDELTHDIGFDQPGLLEHGVGRAADQCAETLQPDAGIALVEAGR